MARSLCVACQFPCLECFVTGVLLASESEASHTNVASKHPLSTLIPCIPIPAAAFLHKYTNLANQALLSAR